MHRKNEQIKQLAYFPPENVSSKDIKENGFLFSKEDLEIVRSAVAKLKKADREKGIKLSKKDLFPKNFTEKYSVIVAKNSQGEIKTYIKYKGEKKEIEEHEKRILGKGKSGVVKSLQDLDTGEWVACKIIRDPKAVKSDNVTITESLKNELQELREVETESYGSFVDHEDVIQTDTRIEASHSAEIKEYKILCELNSGRGYFRHTSRSKDVDQEYIVMELRPGIKLSKILKQQTITSEQFLAIISQLLKIIVELQNLEMIHRDVKPGNILVDLNRMIVSLVDVADVIKVPRGIDSIVANVRGTRGYAKPSINKSLQAIDDNELSVSQILITYTYKTSMYSIGKIIEELLQKVNDPSPLLLEIKNYVTTFVEDNTEIFNYNNMRKEKFIHDVLHDENFEKKLPTAQEMIEKYNLDVKSKPKSNISIGVLICKNLINQPESDWQAMLPHLKKYDEVMLLSNDPTVPFEKYIKLKHFLEKNGVLVNPKIAITSLFDLKETLSWLQKQNVSKNISYDYVSESLGRIERQKLALNKTSATSSNKLEKITPESNKKEFKTSQKFFLEKEKIKNKEVITENKSNWTKVEETFENVKDKINLFKNKIEQSKVEPPLITPKRKVVIGKK